jgi:hypothetical protein
VQSAPIIPFPNLSGLTPTPPIGATGNKTAPTRLSKALKACRKQPRKNRAACVKRAKRKYGAKRKYATSISTKHRLKTGKK